MYFFKHLLGLLPLALLANTVFGQPTLTPSDAVSQTGHFQLQWHYYDAENNFELQQAQTPGFTSPRTIYTGQQKARTMSGVLNGTYYFRVRLQDGDWSNVVKVKVEHYELATAFMFLGLGAIVFFATATLVIRGHLSHRKTRCIGSQ